MKPSGISDELKRFITAHIDSVGKLEILLLLARNQDKEWSEQEISRTLRSNDALVAKYLAELCASKLIVCDKTTRLNRFHPETADAEKNVKDLIVAYGIFQVRIIQLIYEKPVSSIQQFADAFKIRKGDDDNG
jgi:hypothetical protein